MASSDTPAVSASASTTAAGRALGDRAPHRAPPLGGGGLASGLMEKLDKKHGKEGSKLDEFESHLFLEKTEGALSAEHD